jgi:hypothetical protein
LEPLLPSTLPSIEFRFWGSRLPLEVFATAAPSI